MHTPPKVALVGRTNVGKSSLFNRLVEEQRALVSALPGTTRDRQMADCLWRGGVITLIDTGGLDVNQSLEIEKDVVKQAGLAIEQADVILFVVDLMVGATADDQRLARELMKTKKPIVVVGNKGEKANVRDRVNGPDWRSWSLKKPLAISAKQGLGTGDLLDELTRVLIAAGKPPIQVADLAPIKVCVVGEPNVGKSTLLNSLLGEERFITAATPHTTRGPNDILVERGGKLYQFIDTAGLRKQASRRKGKDALEIAGANRTVDSLEKAAVALFVVDLVKGITAQERHLAGKIEEAGVSTIIVANKWDLIPNKQPNTLKELAEEVQAWMPPLDFAPVHCLSALTGQRTQELYKLIEHVYNTRFTQLSGTEAHKFMSQAIARHRPIRGKGVKHPKITLFEQTHVHPPIFDLHVNLSREDSLSPAYVRFLENQLRERYDFIGTPIRINIQSGKKSHTTYISAIKPEEKTPAGATDQQVTAHKQSKTGRPVRKNHKR